MFSFRNDYSEGAHPLVLEALAATNLEQHVGYTEDELCAAARASIVREVFSADTTGVLARAGIAPQDIQVEFVAGGTMANLLSSPQGFGRMSAWWRLPTVISTSTRRDLWRLGGIKWLPRLILRGC